MRLLQGDSVPFAPADPNNFVGSARVKKLPMVEDGTQSVIVYLVQFEPGEKHWHGAAPATGMAHFAVNLTLTTEWLEPVSDDQYRAS